MNALAIQIPEYPSMSLANWFGKLEPGEVIDGHKVERMVGEGAMASLYLVCDSEGRERVIKVPRHAKNIDPVSVVAFENELRLSPYLAGFRYAYMPQVGGISQRPYLSMDYIRGQDLWTRLKEHGCCSETETLTLGIKIANAVSELHRRRIVHLDLKLSNVMLTPENEVRLIDFGLANHLDLPDIIFESFREPKGTPAYIAPEQMVGVRTEPRSDVFSVGVILFELSTAALPFADGGTVRDVVSRIKSRPETPRHYRPQLSPAFEQIVARCLRPNPEDRFASMDALGEALESCLNELRLNEQAAMATAMALPVDGARSSGLIARLSSYLRTHWFGQDATLYEEVRRWAEKHRAQRNKPYRILAALKLDRKYDALNRSILQQVQLLASAQPGAYVTILNAARVDVGAANSEKEAEETNIASMQARECVLSLLESIKACKLTINVNIVASNHPEDAIQQHVLEYGADVLVIGCRRKNPVAAFLHGRTGYRILTSVPANVFVVHERALPQPQTSVPCPTTA